MAEPKRLWALPHGQIDGHYSLADENESDAKDYARQTNRSLVEFVSASDYTTLSRERDQALSAHADMVAELEASRAEFERLRRVEADAQMARTRLEAVERAVTAVSEAMMMRATHWKGIDGATWAGESLTLFAVSLAEACGRKG